MLSYAELSWWIGYPISCNVAYPVLLIPEYLAIPSFACWIEYRKRCGEWEAPPEALAPPRMCKAFSVKVNASGVLPGGGSPLQCRSEAGRNRSSSRSEQLPCKYLFPADGDISSYITQPVLAMNNFTHPSNDLFLSILRTSWYWFLNRAAYISHA